MSYDESTVRMGVDHLGNDIYGGFRFVVPVPQGSTLTSGLLMLWLERKYRPGMTVLDTFTDDTGTLLTAHTMDVGPPMGWVAYVQTSYAITIESNQAELHHGLTIYVCECGEADGTVQVEAKGSTKGVFGLVFRLRDGSNYWYFIGRALWGYIPAYLRLYKMIDDVPTMMGDNAYAFGVTPDFHTFKVVMNGSNIKCYLNDVLYFDVDDSDLVNATKVGLYGYPAYYAEETYWDDFEFIPSGISSPNLQARCENVGNSADFQTGGLPNTRVLTSGSQDLGDISGWSVDAVNTTVDITAPLQEVIDGEGWLEGNYLSVIVYPTDACEDGERYEVTSYEGTPARAAKLGLTWS